MVQSTVEYQGQLHCKITHGPSGISIATDAPKDNMGKGESFSPTDLVGAALASCILTTMGIMAQRNDVDMSGATAVVKKEMVVDPVRRIGRLEVEIRMTGKFSDEIKKKLEHAAHSCPVHKSLHHAVAAPITIHWP